MSENTTNKIRARKKNINEMVEYEILFFSQLNYTSPYENTKNIFLLTFAFLALILFSYDKNNEDLIFKSDFYLQDDNLSELPE